MSRRFRRLAQLLAAAGTALAVLLGGLAPGAVYPARAIEGVVVTGDTTLIVQPDRHRVHARVDLRIRNARPSTTRAGVTTDWIIKEWAIAIPDEATHVRVTRGGAPQPTTVRERDGYDQVTFDLRPDVAFGKTAAVRITYDLPDGGARSNSPIRIGRAYISFYAFAHGDDHATLRIEVPAGFDVETRGGEIVASADADGRTILTTNGSVDDLRWYVFVDGDRSDALEKEALQVDLGGQPRFLEVRSWPEDDLWAAQVRDLLTRGLVALQELNGLDWPVAGPLRVTESATRSLNGYAGFYDPGESGVLDEITISEQPDELVIVHEAAHAWFNDGLLTGRWISEGLADAYAARALEGLGSSQPDPEPVFRDTRVAFALNLWGPPERIDNEAAQAREAYGYDASRQVIDSLIDEIGEARMREVLAAADAQTIAFAGAPKRETHTLLVSFRDWRYLLDLLQQVGGSRQAADLFETFVASDVELPLLADHEAAVRRYAELVERADGWRPAHALRSQMARWAFDYIDRELELAGSALDRRAAIEPLEARLGLDDGGALRSAFEGAVVSYDNVVSLGDEELETLDVVAAAQAAVAAERDALVTIGLLGSDTTVDLAEAAAAYRAGHLGDSSAQAAEAIALIDGADEVGTGRAAVGAGVGLMLVVIVLGSGILVVGRRRRPARVPVPALVATSTFEAPDPPATLAAPTQPSVADVSSEVGATEGEEGT
jgi:hypothetical protein